MQQINVHTDRNDLKSPSWLVLTIENQHNDNPSCVLANGPIVLSKTCGKKHSRQLRKSQNQTAHHSLLLVLLPRFKKKQKKKHSVLLLHTSPPSVQRADETSSRYFQERGDRAAEQRIKKFPDTVGPPMHPKEKNTVSQHFFHVGYRSCQIPMRQNACNLPSVVTMLNEQLLRTHDLCTSNRVIRIIVRCASKRALPLAVFSSPLRSLSFPSSVLCVSVPAHLPPLPWTSLQPSIHVHPD